MLRFMPQLLEIPLESPNPTEPRWINPYFFGLDAAALYSLVAGRRPGGIIEVGSGYSSLFARRAIRDHRLSTHITAIDPQPRLALAGVADEVIQQPLEELDLGVMERLGPGDILFVDGSHYCFMNSDSTIVFLEILPRLRPGVMVHIHDVFLPWDYRPDWTERYYAEQYLLAALLLGGGGPFEITLPLFYIYCQPELAEVLAPLWTTLGLSDYQTAGHSFWLSKSA
jgi:hypothetical protein